MSIARIAFIGTGSMGEPIAGRLLDAGYRLTVHDRREEAASRLVGAGARWAGSARECVVGADLVLMSLPSHLEVQQVCAGPDGVLAAMAPGTALVDLSTVSVRHVDVLQELTAAAGLRYVAAPVSQGVDGARRGRLSVFAGGAPEDVDHVRPVLARFASRVIRTGPPATAITAKLVTNLLWFVNAAAIGEALVLGAKGGIPLPTLHEVILASCGTSWVAEHDVPSVYDGTFDPSFTTELCLKDLTLIAELAELEGVPLGMTAAARAMFERASDRYGARSPELSVVRYLQEECAVPLQTAPAPDPEAAVP